MMANSLLRRHMALAFTAAVLLLTTGLHPLTTKRVAAQTPSNPSRIVSLIPAVTEMLFAIGAGPQVVAVSSFDQYPAEVKSLPRVGALLDPDLERIIALRPDLVIVYESQTDFRRQLERANVPLFVYKHAGLADVLTTMTAIGTRIGRQKEAEKAVAEIASHLERIRMRVSSRPKPSTLLVFGRDSLTLRGVYASGGVGFLHDMLSAAGGTNVFADVRRESVQATSELILARRPDVIVELRYGEMQETQRTREVDVWSVLASVPAVRNKRVAIINDERMVVPGPRVAEGTELMARTLHPEAFTR